MQEGGFVACGDGRSWWGEGCIGDTDDTSLAADSNEKLQRMGKEFVEGCK